jgi:hypothetical protein
MLGLDSSDHLVRRRFRGFKGSANPSLVALAIARLSRFKSQSRHNKFSQDATVATARFPPKTGHSTWPSVLRFAVIGARSDHTKGAPSAQATDSSRGQLRHIVRRVFLAIEPPHILATQKLNMHSMEEQDRPPI